MVRPLVPLPEDKAFIDRAIGMVRKSGVMRDPQFDREACQLVESSLRIDLLNVWHTTTSKSRVEADERFECWIHPKNLANACSYGRVDIVQSAIDRRTELDGQDGGGNPIASAIGAFCTTALHVKCVELLLAAGAKVSDEQFRMWTVESMGSAIDDQLMALLVKYARQSDDPAIRQIATGVNSPRG
jgi:hypothetical protein